MDQSEASIVVMWLWMEASDWLKFSNYRFGIFEQFYDYFIILVITCKFLWIVCGGQLVQVHSIIIVRDVFLLECPYEGVSDLNDFNMLKEVTCMSTQYFCNKPTAILSEFNWILSNIGITNCCSQRQENSSGNASSS